MTVWAGPAFVGDRRRQTTNAFDYRESGSLYPGDPGFSTGCLAPPKKNAPHRGALSIHLRNLFYTARSGLGRDDSLSIEVRKISGY
jgi:hypothetical protein